MLRLDNARVTFTSSRGAASSLGGGRTSLIRVSLPMGMSASDVLFIVAGPLSPITRAEYPDLSVTMNITDRHDLVTDLPDAKETWFDSAMPGVGVNFSIRVQECLCGRCEIDAVLADVDQLLLGVPHEVSGAHLHCL